jgi:uncharacterized membrane protein YfcA
MEFFFSAFSSQPLPTMAAVVAAFAAFLMGFSRSGIGAGGFVVSPLMVFALGPADGLAVVAILMLPAAVTGVWQHRGEADPGQLRALIFAAVLGTFVGGLILWALVLESNMVVMHRRLEIMVAMLSLVFVALIALRNRIAQLTFGSGKPSTRGLFFAGTLTGITQTVANSGSPLLTVYFLCYRIARQQFVGAQVIFLLIQNTLKVLPLVALGILHLGNAGAAVLLIPLTMIGSFLGQLFFRKASERAFFGLYMGLLLIGFVASVLLLVGRDQVLGTL